MWKQVKALRVLLPNKFSWQKALLGCGVICMVVGAYYWGHWGASSQDTAKQKEGPSFSPANGVLYDFQGEDPGRPVARVFKGKTITRQELGEYLIARFGPERLEFLINSKIVELACKSRGIYVTEAEIEAQLVRDLEAMNVVDLNSFVNVILKRFGKSLYEYKEDVIRPKIALSKLCVNEIKVTQKDVQDAFEAKFGEKRECRIIVFGKDQKNIDQVWTDLQTDKDDVKFNEYARKINPQPLNADGGKVPPIHKHFPNKDIESQAFSLKPGEISSKIDLPDGTKMILKCDKIIPADTTRQLEVEEGKLRHEVFDRKLSEAIPMKFQELQKEAIPVVYLKREEPNQQAVQRVNHVLQQAAAKRDHVPQPPVPAGVLEPSSK